MRVEVKALARAIFLTCRRISEECITTFYHDLILEFTDFRDLLDFIQRTSLPNRNRIRRLRYLHAQTTSTFLRVYSQAREISLSLPPCEFLLCTRSTRKGDFKATLLESGKDLPPKPVIFWVRGDGSRAPDYDPPLELILYFRRLALFTSRQRCL
jgi:hypothetical protein